MTPVSVGTTRIKAKILNYESNEVVVTVTQPLPETVTVSPSTASVERGRTTNFTATVSPDTATTTAVDWSSSDEKIATVDGNGVVTGVGIGTVTITATAQGDNTKTGTATITVTKPSAVNLSMSASASAYAGTNQTFGITLYDNEGKEITSGDSLDVENSTITWSSGSASIVGDLSSCQGLTTCSVPTLNSGSTTITATVASNAAATQSITVNGYKLSDKMVQLKKDGDSTLMYDEQSATAYSSIPYTNGNLRYTGANDNVNNYVWFNCDKNAEPSESTCEKWRIVGVFSVGSDVDTTDNKNTQKNPEIRVKLMKEESIGAYSWNTGKEYFNSRDGSTDWTGTLRNVDGDLMKLLNYGYSSNEGLNNSGETVTVNNSLYWNRSTGNCYTDRANVATECDFTTNGLKSEGVSDAKEMIGKAYWNLGGLGSSSQLLSNYINTMYAAERSDTSSGAGGPYYWLGKVGLIYPSDYAYAGWNCNKNYKAYDSSDSDDIRNCTNESNWMWITGSTEWLLSASNTTTAAYRPWYHGGSMYYGKHGAGQPLTVRPSIYLKSNVIVMNYSDTDGSASKPYIIKLGS